MQAAYGWAHLVVSRAGALSVAELEASGRPAVLVPYPFAAGNHQEANARAAAKRGGAVCLLDVDLEQGALAGVVKELLGTSGRLQEMATAGVKGAVPTAVRGSFRLTWLRAGRYTGGTQPERSIYHGKNQDWQFTEGRGPQQGRNESGWWW